MDNDSGDDETDELREFDWEEWEKEWSGLGWRNVAGSLFQRHNEMHNEMSGQWFLEEDDGGRETERKYRRRRTSFNMRWVNRDQISEVASLSSSKNFIM